MNISSPAQYPAYKEIVDGVSAFCIPPHAPIILRPYSFTTYHVLIKSPLGRIAKFEVKQRSLPDRDWFISLGKALDRVALFPEAAATQDKKKLNTNSMSTGLQMIFLMNHFGVVKSGCNRRCWIK